MASISINQQQKAEHLSPFSTLYILPLTCCGVMLTIYSATFPIKAISMLNSHFLVCKFSQNYVFSKICPN